MKCSNKINMEKFKVAIQRSKSILIFDRRGLNPKRLLFFGFSIIIMQFSNGQDLRFLIEEALKNNPQIQKYELRYQLATEKIHEVRSIPNTEIGFGLFASEPETRTGAQRFKLSANQMIPWFGTLTARENYMSSIADADYEDIAIAKRQVAASVAQTYYKMYALKATQKVLIENIQLLKTYETLALTSVEVGNASAVDVLRLQMRENELDQSHRVLAQLYLTEQTALNKILNRDKSIIVEVTDTLEIPLESDMNLSENLELHPELTKYDKLFQSVEQSEMLNQKEASPMLGLGIDYVAVTERPNMNFSDNGKDIMMPMISVSIPVFNKKYKSRTKQNELKQQEITSEKQERLNSLETALNNAINKRITARISHDTQEKNLKQARYAEEILIKSFETGTLDFNEILDIQELQLKFQINQIESIKNYYVQTTIINYLSSSK